ncbi:unnamed protein product [Gordionus sp. m RMFG-2023]
MLFYDLLFHTKLCVGNIKNVETTLTNLIAKHPDLGPQYTALLEKYRALAEKLRNKNEIGSVFSKLEFVLDEIENELRAGAYDKVVAPRNSSKKRPKNPPHSNAGDTDKTRLIQESSTTNHSTSSSPRHVTISLDNHDIEASKRVTGGPGSQRWLCRTKDISGADLWLLVLLNEVEILGLSHRYWNESGLRPYIRNYLETTRQNMSPSNKPVFRLLSKYRLPSKSHRGPHALLAAACFRAIGIRSPRTIHYAVFYFGVAFGLITLAATTMYLVYRLRKNKGI